MLWNNPNSGLGQNYRIYGEFAQITGEDVMGQLQEELT